MGTTTGLILRQRLSEALGGYYSLTADSTSGSSSITDAALANITENDDGIESDWIAVTSGSASGDIRRLKSSAGYTASSTVLDPNQNFSASVASGNTYELHRYHPELLRNAINQAIRGLYPRNGRKGLYRRLLDTSLAVDNLLLNSDMETGTFTSWTAVGSPTVTAETTIFNQGTQSAKVVGGSVCQLTQAPHISVEEMTGRTATLEFWVYTTAPNTARVRLDWGSSNFQNSGYHSGKDQWEFMKAEATIPDSASQVKAILENEGGTVYFSSGYLKVGKLTRYTIPTAMRGGPNFVNIQYRASEPNGSYYPLNGAYSPGRRFRLEGTGILSQPTSDSATTEVDGEQVELIVAEAARLFWMSRQGDKDAPFEMAKWTGRAAELREEVGMKLRPAEVSNYWSIQENIGTRELVLEPH